MTTFVRKFSQFVAQNVLSPVGLTSGANSIGPSSGSGASITYTFTQLTPVVPPLYLGAAVRVDVASGLWECTLATTPLAAEFYGFIVAISGGTTYTVQFAGEVPPGTPLLTGLINGTPYYLSDSVAGGISAAPPAVTGEVNLPVLWAMDNGNSVIKMSRGFIEGSGGGGGGGTSPNNVATVTQAGNTFRLGDVLYLLSDQTFALAHARTLASAQAEWMVTSIVTPGSVFIIQQGGKVQSLVTTDDVGAPIVSGPIYYVSPIVGQEGKLTQVNPVSAGLFSKPFYVQEVLSSNTGWLLDQRPLSAQGNGNVFLGYLNVANGFSSTSILSGYNEYALLLRAGNSSTDYGIRATAATNIGFGFQFYIDGAWDTTPQTYFTYVSGVNSTAGANTATLWGHVENNVGGPTRDSAIFFPPTSTSIIATTGNGILSLGPIGSALIDGSFAFIDHSGVMDIGYTSLGTSGGGSGVNITGIRVFFGAGATIDPSCTGYIAVYGIPNS